MATDETASGGSRALFLTMDNMLYTIAKSLLMPPGGLILIFLLGFLLVRGVLGRMLIFVGLTVLTLMSLPKVAAGLIADLEPYPALAPPALIDAGAEAILILGGDRYSWAPEYGGDTVGGKTLQRLRYGAFLHRQTGLPVYLTGGSPPEEYPPLGRLMAGVLEGEYGIAAAGVEDRSQTTEENAALSSSMLRADGIGKVLLVTHAWHMPRALDAFARAGVEAIPAPTYFAHREGAEDRGSDYRDWLPSAGAFSVSYFALHEWIGQVWYQLKASAETSAGGEAKAGG